MASTIRAARLFDGVSLVDSPAVALDGDSIAAVRPGDGGSAGSPADLDFGDATILPGLIDSHVHFCFDATRSAVANATSRTDEELYALMPGFAASMLHAGVTVARDLGDRGYLSLRLRDELAARPASGPRVLASGPAITTKRGHLWFFGGECESADEIRAMVAGHARHGVDVIKIMATGGELTEGSHSWLAQFSQAELRAAVEAAHAAGLPITAHAHGRAGIANAVAAGVDSLEHCTFIAESGVEVDDEILAAVAASGVRVCMTMGLVPGLPMPPRIAAMLADLDRMVGRVWHSGAPIVLASDCGIGPAKPHALLPHTIEQVVRRAGVEPAAALRASTWDAAVHCGVGDRHGRVAAGYSADLLVVRGNPLTDISAVHDVLAVFRAGVRVR